MTKRSDTYRRLTSNIEAARARRGKKRRKEKKRKDKKRKRKRTRTNRDMGNDINGSEFIGHITDSCECTANEFRLPGSELDRLKVGEVE